MHGNFEGGKCALNRLGRHGPIEAHADEAMRIDRVEVHFGRQKVLLVGLHNVRPALNDPARGSGTGSKSKNPRRRARIF